MYNTNHQQDRGQQAPNVKPAPRGGHFVLHKVINRNADAIGEIMVDAINRKREDKQ